VAFACFAASSASFFWYAAIRCAFRGLFRVVDELPVVVFATEVGVTVAELLATVVAG
jgi:hypothetical protein